MVELCFSLCLKRAWTSGGALLLPLSQTSFDKWWSLDKWWSFVFSYVLKEPSLDKWWSFTSLYISRKPSLDKWWSSTSLYLMIKAWTSARAFFLYVLKEPSLDKWWSFSSPSVSNELGQVVELCFSFCLK